MKKFRFSLDNVLSYKQQILDSLQAEHGLITAQVRAQEERVAECWSAYRACGVEYQERASVGLVMMDAMMYQTRLRAMEREIQQETERLEELRKQEEAKRAQVVEAKKDSTSIEKLREKKLSAYHKEAAKDEERQIEDFVSLTRLTSQAAM